MNEQKKNMLRGMGFRRKVEMIDRGRCPMCENCINLDHFRDDISRKEFEISGMCQTCQDETFGEG